MAINFPSSLDTLTNPISSDKLNSPTHAGQHSDANDAVEALEAKVGADSSAVTSSLDYKVSNVSSVDPGHSHTTVSGNAGTATTLLNVGYNQSLGETSFTGAITYQQKVSLSHTTAAGVWKISIACSISCSVTNEHVGVRCQVDDTTTMCESSIKMDNTYANNSWSPVSFVGYTTLTGAAHTFDLDYSITDANDTVYIRRANIIVERIS